ncbi:hypothetical protein AWV80_23340 [Cupriavidus sp. UYMU48A]|nr:hypothetical protein AWV80_23340 [Cupriavidus sp. UYMU48A]
MVLVLGEVGVPDATPIVPDEPDSTPLFDSYGCRFCQDLFIEGVGDYLAKSMPDFPVFKNLLDV